MFGDPLTCFQALTLSYLLSPQTNRSLFLTRVLASQLISKPKSLREILVLKVSKIWNI